MATTSDPFALRRRRRSAPHRAACAESLEARALLAVNGGPPPLLPPADVAATTPIGGAVTVTWTDTNDAETGYQVERSLRADGGFWTAGVVAADVIRFADLHSLLTGRSYYYRVRALGEPVPSAYSPVVDVVVPHAGESLSDIDKENFSDASDMRFSGAAFSPDTDGSLRLTGAAPGARGAAFFKDPRRLVYGAGFDVAFDFRIRDGANADVAEGFVFVLHNDPRGLDAAADTGGGAALGWGGIANSVGVTFDVAPGRLNQTGLYADGATPSDDPADPRNRIVPPALPFESGRTYRVNLAYEPYFHTLTQTIDDLDDPSTPAFRTTYTIDIPAALGANAAYVGFTGANAAPKEAGGEAGIQILKFHYGRPIRISESGRITAVYLAGPGWGRDTGGPAGPGREAFRALLGIDRNHPGYVAEGSNQLRPIPWLGGVDRIAVRVDPFVGDLSQDDLVVRGADNAAYGFSGFHFDRTTYTGFWTLARPAVRGNLTIVLHPRESMDGFWINPSPENPAGDTFPSGGDGPGSAFNYRVNVLAGDTTGDGRINALDLGDVKRRLGRRPSDGVFGAGGYSAFADLTADGVINALDLAAVRQRLGERIINLLGPAVASSPPPAAAASPGGPLRWLEDDGVLGSQAPPAVL